jgi:hypothetical protein
MSHANHEQPNRRGFIRLGAAASAVVAGIAAAAPAGATIAASTGHAALPGAESILALGRDPVAVLGEELNVLNAWYTNCPDEVSDEVGEQVVAIEDRIAAMIPTSAAGAIVQILILQRLSQVGDWGEWHDKLADNLIAGLRALAAGGAA